MKQMTCAQMGGPAACTTIISGNTAEEMVKNGMDHITKEHPDMAADVKKTTPEATTARMDDFRKKFDAVPEM